MYNATSNLVRFKNANIFFSLKNYLSFFLPGYICTMLAL
jgi:hypothetical protein